METCKYNPLSSGLNSSTQVPIDGLSERNHDVLLSYQSEASNSIFILIEKFYAKLVRLNGQREGEREFKGSLREVNERVKREIWSEGLRWT